MSGKKSTGPSEAKGGSRFTVRRVRYLRIVVQVLLVIVLNLTVIGNIMLSPFLPILRLDLPWLPRGELHLCPLSTIQRGLGHAWSFGLFLLVLGVMTVICLLVGRALCAWACPFGLFQDMITRLRAVFKLGPRELGLKTHQKLGSVRFALLFTVILLSLSMTISYLVYEPAGEQYVSHFPAGTTRVAPYCSGCPTPTLYYTVTVFQTGDLQFSDPTHYLMWGVLFVFIIGAFLIPRFWCRYFCPVGAMSSCFNSVSVLKIHKDIPKCTKCNYCVSNCPMRVQDIRDEDEDSRVSSWDCTFCLECVEKCPEKALSLRFGGKTIYRGGREWWARLGKK